MMTQDNYDYTIDVRTRRLLMESAPMMWDWSRHDCASKSVGGMEEWAKEQNVQEISACDWYHGTWVSLRLLNMVATPPWYPFYMKALGKVLTERPKANVLISAAADWGMLAQLHEAVEATGATPTITLYDICRTPLLASEWYAKKHGFTLNTVCDNIITSSKMPLGSYDLIVTDEFLTVLKDDYKPLITARWRELLKPGGTLVTTAMVGGPTTPNLRAGFAARAKRLYRANEHLFKDARASEEELLNRFNLFAKVHTRHMLTSPEQLRSLFTEFKMESSLVVTPGECVNPTNSFQIVATRPE